MKFTLPWLKEHLETDASLDAIVERLTSLGLEVDEVEPRGADLRPFKVALVTAVRRHPEAEAFGGPAEVASGGAVAPGVNAAQASGRVFEVIRDVAKRYEHIIIDSGGHASDAMKSALLGAQKLYVPLRPSQADLETVGEMRTLIADVKAFNHSLQAFSLLSLASTNPSVLEPLEAREALQDLPELRVSECLICDRKVYRDAFFEGVGVIEMSSNKGIPEIQRLAHDDPHGPGHYQPGAR
jgi:chromosome partitioning protein